jgi:hypothetical protein
MTRITNGYVNVYGPILAPLRSKPIKLLELGVLAGESLRLWQEYFWNGTIVGLDLRPVTINDPMERIFVYQGAQQDTALLSRIAQERASDGFDIIIDDASHIADLTRISFWHLFDNHLKPGGLHVVEDWGTGYWSDWADGMTYRQHPFFRERILSLLKFIRASRRIPSYSHSFGMVGFIKELVDEMGAHDLTRGLLTGKPKRQSKFRQVLVVPSMVFITKSDSPQSGFRDSVACG